MRFISIFTLVFALVCQVVIAQNSRNIVQFSGLVVGGDSLYGIPGVYLTIPKAGRGTVTNDQGFFSMPTLAGDSVEISTIGYKKKKIVVPKSEKQSITVIIELQEDTTFYPIVEIFPYPTEDVFKKAFLSMKMDKNGMYNNMYSNVDPVLMQRLVMNQNMTPTESFKYSLRNQMYLPGGQVGSGGFNLNPFAWGQTIKAIRKGDYKKKIINDEE